MSVLSDKLNLIWYGDFEDHQNDPCTSFSLADQSAIKRVYRVDGNVWPTYRSGATGNPFETLECGYAYIVELEANQTVNIPHANISPGDASTPRGLLVAEVTLATPTPSPTPTPVSTVCIPTGYTTVPYSSGTEIISGLGTISFNDEGSFGFNPAELSESQGLPRLLEVKTPDGFGVIDVTLQAWPPTGSEPMVYFDCTSSFCAGKCYGGKMKPVTGTDNWEVNLELISSSGPEPTPSPSPSPTPTPVVATECGKPNDASFGTFDLAATAAIEVSSAGWHVTAPDGNSLLVDKGDAEYLTSIGVAPDSLEKASYIMFGHKPGFGEIRGEIIYNRKTDYRDSTRYDGLSRKTCYAFFEDQLPLTGSPAEVIGQAKFTLRKNILLDDDVFLKLDDKCYKATIYSDADNAEAPSGFPTTNFPLVIFREI